MRYPVARLFPFRTIQAAVGGFALLQAGLASAGYVVTTARLDIPNDEIEGVRAEGRARVTVHEGGEVEDYIACQESFTAVQTGGAVDFMIVTDRSTAHICGGDVGVIAVGPQATVRITNGTIGDATIEPGGCIHVYGSELVRTATAVTGKWPDGSSFDIPVSMGGPGGDGVVLHDTGVELLPDRRPFAHYRLDEAGAFRAFDGTTFLHRAAGGEFLTSIPPEAPVPGPRDAAAVTTKMPPLAGDGYSTYLRGGASATIPGDRFPDLDEGATISFWIRLDAVENFIRSVMSKAVPDGTGHPRSMALCLFPPGRLIWVSDGGAGGGGAPLELEIDRTYHLALTFTPVSASQVSGRMFLDGVEVLSAAGGAVDTTDMHFNIGGWAGGEAGIDGMIDDVQIYDRPLADSEITQLYTNPGMTLSDIDSDTMLDDYEFATFGTLKETPDSDYDGDGLSNRAETETTRTDPANFASRFAITDVSSSGGQRSVTFLSSPGVTYQLELSSGIGDWQAVGAPATATGGSTTITHHGGGPAAIYRVSVR